MTFERDQVEEEWGPQPGTVREGDSQDAWEKAVFTACTDMAQSGGNLTYAKAEGGQDSRGEAIRTPVNCRQRHPRGGRARPRGWSDRRGVQV